MGWDKQTEKVIHWQGREGLDSKYKGGRKETTAWIRGEKKEEWKNGGGVEPAGPDQPHAGVGIVTAAS